MKILVSILALFATVTAAEAGESFQIRVPAFGGLTGTIEASSTEHCRDARRALVVGMREQLAGTTITVEECQPAATPAPVVAANACLPPDVPADVFTWPVVAVLADVAKTEAGTLVPFVSVTYAKAPAKVVLGWAQGRLVYLDTAPDDPRAPARINRREIGPGPAAPLLYITPRPGPCAWRSLAETGV